MTQVALYGPSRAGKTALLKALQYQLLRRTRTELNAFQFKITQKLNSGVNLELRNIDADVNPPVPTDFPKGSSILIERSLMGDEYDAETKYVNQHTHELVLTDLAGRFSSVAACPHAITIDDLLATVSDEHRDGINSAWDSYKDANGIIVLLDKGSIKKDRSGLGIVEKSEFKCEPYVATNQFTQQEYARMVERLCNLDPYVGAMPRMISICISKIDKSPQDIYQRTENIIQRDFGKPMIEAILALNNHFNGGEAGSQYVRVFKTSSVGFQRTSDVANYDSETDWLLDTNNWNPYHVADPFLWIFQTNELASIRYVNTRNLLSKVFGISRRKESLYKPYFSGE